MDKTKIEYTRVREEIAKQLANPNCTPVQQSFIWNGIHNYWKNIYLEKADTILEIKGIAVISDNQNLPEKIVEEGFNSTDFMNDWKRLI